MHVPLPKLPKVDKTLVSPVKKVKPEPKAVEEDVEPNVFGMPVHPNIVTM